MAKIHEQLTGALKDWIHRQRMFFVATAPLSEEGHVNCSPKGMDSFRVMDGNRVAYLDFTGSGAETIAHVRENGRIVIMFCAFEGPPQILRLHGQARFVGTDDPEWAEWLLHFPDSPGARGVFVVEVTRICTSCGFAVPEMGFQGERTQLGDWAERKGLTGVKEYQQLKNRASIDGLPALDPDDGRG